MQRDIREAAFGFDRLLRLAKPAIEQCRCGNDFEVSDHAVQLTKRLRLLLARARGTAPRYRALPWVDRARFRTVQASMGELSGCPLLIDELLPEAAALMRGMVGAPWRLEASGV